MATSEADEKITDIKFNFRAVHDSFSSSLLEDDDVRMDDYLIGYKELYKGLPAMKWKDQEHLQIDAWLNGTGKITYTGKDHYDDLYYEIISLLRPCDKNQLNCFAQVKTSSNRFFMLMGKVFGFVASDVKSKIEILEELRKSENGESFLTLKKMIKYESENDLLKKKDYVSGSRTLLRLHRGLDFIRLFMTKVGELSDEEKTHAVCQEAYNSTLANFHPWIVRKGAVVAMYALPTRGALLRKVCGPEEVQHALDILPKMLQVAGEVYDRTQKCYTENDLHGLP